MEDFRLTDLIRRPELLQRDTIPLLRQHLERHPYNQTLRLLLLKNLYQLHDPEFNAELRRSAPLLADRRVLFDLVEGAHYEIEPAPAVQEAPNGPDDRTFDLIDSFLHDIPQEKPKRRLTEADAAQDYAAYLLQEEENARQKQVSPRREAPSGGAGQPVVSPEARASAADDDLDLTPDEKETPSEEFFTETLAQIYIKQQKYSRALEIIKALSLNNPKKNSYFADQIRFLEKLVLIERHKNSKNIK